MLFSLFYCFFAFSDRFSANQYIISILCRKNLGSAFCFLVLLFAFWSFLYAKAQKNHKLRRYCHQEKLPWVILQKRQINQQNDTENQNSDDNSVVAALVPNRVQNQKSYQRSGDCRNENYPKSMPQNPENNKNQNCQSPDAEYGNQGNYCRIVFRQGLFFFGHFRFPLVVAVD